MASSKPITLKLLVDTKANKVLFAEANKDFVDFLCYLLSLPVGTVTNLLSKQSMVGSLGKLYSSIETLSDTYIQPNQSKDSILKPKLQFTSGDVPLMLGHYEEHDERSGRKIYMCPCFHRHVAENPKSVCPSCSQTMIYEVPLVAAPIDGTKGLYGGDEGGFVKGVVTYMVMDDLEVKPMSTISSITLLNKFNVQEIGVLEEIVVEVGMNEGLKLLKESLQSEKVLTNVFLDKRGA